MAPSPNLSPHALALCLALVPAPTFSPASPPGAQNLLSQKSGLIKGNTTFMTGNIQKMAEALWNLATKKGGLKLAEKRGAFLLFLTWALYIVGGVLGAELAMVLEADQTQTPPLLSPHLHLLTLTPTPHSPPPPTLTATLTIGSSSTGH